MANSLSGLSTLKRIRSSSTSTSAAKKESKINIILNKLATSLYGGGASFKKRKQEKAKCVQRKSSAGQIIDYFRSATTAQDNHPFANDALFELSRYKQQKKLNSESAMISNCGNNVVFSNDIPTRTNSSHIPVSTTATGGGILLNKSSTGHHRHNPSATSFILKSSQMNEKKPYQHHRHTHSTPPAMTTKPATTLQVPEPMVPLAVGHSKSNSSSSSSARKGAHGRHIRHYSHVSCISSSNITVNSEDLTAKEFADIAGIRILSEEDEALNSSNHNTSYSYYDAISNQSVVSKKLLCSVCGKEGGGSDKLPSLILSTKVGSNISTSSHPHYLRHQSSHSGITDSSILPTPSNNNSTLYANDSHMLLDDEDEEMPLAEISPPHIWDDDFWRLPNSKQQALSPAITNNTNQKSMPIVNTLTVPSNPAPIKIPFESVTNDTIEAPPILHELKKQHAKSNSFSAGQNSTTFIKRGRFEIHLSDDNYSKNSCGSGTAAVASKKPEMVVEWKRKVRPTPTATTCSTIGT